MKTYAFILLAMLAGCSFSHSALGNNDDEINDIATLSGRRAAEDGGSAGRGAEIDMPDADVGEQPDGNDVDVDADVDVHLEPDAAVDGGAPVPDATMPLPDASQPDASQPDAGDAAMPSGFLYTDHKICQPCSAPDFACGPQTICYAAKGVCLPLRPKGLKCDDVCGGLFPGTADFGNGVGCIDEVNPPCRPAQGVSACFN